MEAWGEHGAWVKREIHDYLLIRACEEVGVRPPTFPSPKMPDPIQMFPSLWMGVEVPAVYHQLATKAAWHAALLVGIRKFDRFATGTSLTLARRAAFKRMLSKELEEFLDRIPELKQQNRQLVSDLGRKLGTAITRRGEDVEEDQICSFAASAFVDAVKAFARVYVAALNPV